MLQRNLVLSLEKPKQTNKRFMCVLPLEFLCAKCVQCPWNQSCRRLWVTQWWVLGSDPGFTARVVSTAEPLFQALYNGISHGKKRTLSLWGRSLFLVRQSWAYIPTWSELGTYLVFVSYYLFSKLVCYTGRVSLRLNPQRLSEDFESWYEHHI